jgi:hypothetical protein
VILKANFQEITMEKKMGPQIQSCAFARAPKFGKSTKKTQNICLLFFEYFFTFLGNSDLLITNMMFSDVTDKYQTVNGW